MNCFLSVLKEILRESPCDFLIFENMLKARFGYKDYSKKPCAFIHLSL